MNMILHHNPTLNSLVDLLIEKLNERWNNQLSYDAKTNIIECLKKLAENCPEDEVAIEKRRVLIKNTYELLIRIVKCGFTFDEASSSYGKQIHYLSYDSAKSINIPPLQHTPRERERERERAILKTL